MGKEIKINKGEKFGRLEIIKELSPIYFNKSNIKKRTFLVKCDCGNKKSVRLDYLRSGRTTSCGCFHSEVVKNIKTKHNLSNKKIYHTWNNMIARCKYKTHDYYHCYGGRGIVVCNEWKIFENFADWAISNGYKKELVIDRIDNNGNYEPNNCRWVTQKQNARNRSDNIYIEFNSKIITLIELSEILNISYSTLNTSYNRHGKEKFQNEKILYFMEKYNQKLLDEVKL